MIHVYEKIRSVEFDQLPEPLRQVYLAPPVVSVPVESVGDGFREIFSARLGHTATEAYVPKLGIKSWRDSGSLGVIYQGVKIRSSVELLLNNPTNQQRLIAPAWIKSNIPLKLHLSPYIDFSPITEVRFLVNHRGCHRVSACLREQSWQQFQKVLPRIISFVSDIAKHLNPYSHIVDVAYLPNGAIRLVEINPGLTPKDIKDLVPK